MGTISTAPESVQPGDDIDALLSSYLSDEEKASREEAERPALDSPVPLEQAEGEGAGFWSFRRAVARQAKLGRNVPKPADPTVSARKKTDR